MKRNTFLMALFVLLVLAGSALAMSSANYRLDWFTPMTGSGGTTDSANYAANFTVGQAVVGAPSSANYEVCLGYWCRVDEVSCTSLTDVSVDGPSAGYIEAQYAFTATVQPLSATLPITYTWSPPPDAGAGEVVSYTWATTGTKVITVTAQNCEGVIVSSTPHTITIASEDSCTSLTDVSVDGPSAGYIEAQYAFTATVQPLSATLPITYTWSPPPDAGAGEVVSYTWATTGTKVITVTAENCAGVIVNSDHTIAIEAPRRYIYLPLVLRGS